MIKMPPYLKAGDTVRILATARKIDQHIINDAVGYLENVGFKVELGQHLFQAHHQFAGTDNQRAQDFQNAIDADHVTAILCARGGYGTIKMMDLIDWRKFKTHPKWVVGYSDPTVIHNQIHKLGFGSLHATMPINYKTNSAASLTSLFNHLQGKKSDSWQIENHPLNVFGATEGPLVGGNLSMIYSTMGTPFQINTVGKILFLEDLDEYLYHIDRMMENLDKSGLLSHLKGLVVGGMTDMNDNTIPFGAHAEKIIRDIAEKYGYPIAFNLPAGHSDHNLALKLGSTYHLDVQSTQTYFSCKE